MGALKLLEIIAYEDKDLLVTSGKTFVAMVNPGNYTYSKGIHYNANGAMNGGKAPTYQAYEGKDLRLEFTLDSTGALYDWMNPVTSQNLLPLPGRIKTLEETVYKYDGKAHEPSYIRILWGTLNYTGRLKTLDVKYTLFNSEGEPVRALVKLLILEYIDPKTQEKQKNSSSPDLTHLVTVKAGDTLPLLCQRIYKSGMYCSEVARVNNLTGFRDIAPGTQLFFPPLTND